MPAEGGNETGGDVQMQGDTTPQELTQDAAGQPSNITEAAPPASALDGSTDAEAVAEETV